MTGRRRRTPRRTLAAVVGTAVLSGGLVLVPVGAAVAAPQDCAYMGYGSGPDQLGLQWDANERWVADAINAHRAQNGLPALTQSVALARPTMWGALDSALRREAPSNHVDTRGMGPSERAAHCTDTSYPVGTTLGEINYWGKGGTSEDPYYYGSGRAAFEWWKQSPGHNALMLGTQFTHYGVGFAYQGHNAEEGYWVVMFGIA
jgi:uncharacterized protein YkwD